MPVPMPAALTEANLKRIGAPTSGPTQEAQEQALLVKMQALSGLLEQVNGAIDDCPTTTVPSTAASSRRAPPTAGERLPTSGSRPLTTSERMHTGQQRVPTGQWRDLLGPSASAPTADAPRVVSLDELKEQDTPVQLISYTGSQSQLGGMHSKRKVEARATKSEMGSLLSWGGDDASGYYLRRQ